MSAGCRGHAVVRAARRFAGAALVAAAPFIALLAAVAPIGGDALAQPARVAAGTAFPSKPLRIVVPFGAGGIADLTARAVAEHMAYTLGQPIVVDNKPGAGGVVAAEIVAKADPDGHTLLLMSNADAIGQSLFRRLPIDIVRDFTPVGLIGTFDLVIVAAAKAKFESFGELLRYAHANPGKLNLGTINVGSTQHLSAELFKWTFGIDAQIVPFNGTPAVISALRGNQIDVAFEILGPMLPQVQAGAVRALAVTGPARDLTLPDTPTVTEQGLGSFDVSSWNALAAPAQAPPETIARLNQAVNAALADPAVARRLAQLHVRPQPGTPADAAKLLRSEVARWSKVIARAGIPKQ